MKLNKLCMLTLCICCMQICYGSDMTKTHIEDAIPGVSEQFLDDFMVMYEKYEMDFVRPTILTNLFHLLSETIPKDGNSRIDVNQLKNLNSAVLSEYQYNIEQHVKEKVKFTCESTKLAQMSFSRDFPSKRCNGIMNLYYVILCPSATTEETNIVMNYLYENDSTAKEVSFFDKVPDPTAAECPDSGIIYTQTINELKMMVDIKPKVIQDFNTIREKFPCTHTAVFQLRRFVDILEQLGGDKSKISACKIQNEYQESSDALFFNEMSEIVLPARLADEVYRGIVNFEKATFPYTPIDKIEKALEYLYDDVPKTECS